MFRRRGLATVALTGPIVSGHPSSIRPSPEPPGLEPAGTPARLSWPSPTGRRTARFRASRPASASSSPARPTGPRLRLPTALSGPASSYHGVRREPVRLEVPCAPAHCRRNRLLDRVDVSRPRRRSRYGRHADADAAGQAPRAEGDAPRHTNNRRSPTRCCSQQSSQSRCPAPRRRPRRRPPPTGTAAPRRRGPTGPHRPAALRARGSVRRQHSHAVQGAGTRVGRGDHLARPDRDLPEGAGGGRPDTRAPGRVRALLGRPPVARAHRRFAGPHGEARAGQGRPAAPRRPARARPNRGRTTAEGTARGDVARPRRARQRDLLARGRARRGVSPARRPPRPHGGDDPPRVDRPHRPAAEPRRPRPVRGHQRTGPCRLTRRRACCRRARRSVAGRPVEPLSLRHEPRLVLAVAARDARADSVLPRVVSARRGGPPRDGGRLHLLLRASGRSAQSLHHQGPGRLVRRLRP